MEKMLNDLVIEGAKIIFKNFSGISDGYKPAGNRSFSVVLDDDLAHKLADDGWNIKFKTDKDGNPYPPTVEVTVRFDKFPPKIWMVTGKNHVLLNEDTVGQLDNARFENVDLVINPSRWVVRENTGIKAYAKQMVVTIADDSYFKDKYDFLNGGVPASDDESLPFEI